MSLEQPSSRPPTMHDVKQLDMETLYSFALKHMQRLDQKRKWHDKYTKRPNVVKQRRFRYYQKDNIYHPEYNPDGTIEKRYKRTK